MAGAFLIIFTLFWSGMVLLSDGLMVHGIYKQHASTHYAVVTGAITYSEVKSHRTSKGGTSYDASIQYQFEVGGQHFTGNKIRIGMTSSGFANATATVNAHPVGSAVPVFYNPVKPEESLLSPGINGSDFMFTLFLTPFNMVMFGLWIWVGGWLREHFFRPVAGGVKIITDGMMTRIRLPQFPAIAWGIGATGMLGFISMFVVGFAMGMNPSIPMTLSVIVVIYAAGFAVYLWQCQKIRSGIDDLVINEGSRTLELPLTFGRQERVPVNFADIACLAVEKIEHRNSKGGISYTYAPTLSQRKAELTSQKLADWSDKLKADEFTEWLRSRLGNNVPATFSLPSSESENSDGSMAAPTVPAEILRPEHSKIRVSEGPDGREFYFPAARNRGTALGLTIFFLVWSGIFLVLVKTRAPLFFPIVWGITDVLVGFGCFLAWFKTSRVTVNSSDVTVRNGYLLFSRTRRFDTGDVLRFQTGIGTTSGNKTYQAIKLITRAGEEKLAARLARFGQVGGQQMLQSRMKLLGGVTLANGIANHLEADWLVQEMNKAFVRRP